jgi:hypothetical protein
MKRILHALLGIALSLVLIALTLGLVTLLECKISG